MNLKWRLGFLRLCVQYFTTYFGRREAQLHDILLDFVTHPLLLLRYDYDSLVSKLNNILAR